MNNIYNFSPGPSKLPQSVIDRVENSINHYKNTGKSILEISHRSNEFDEILNEINENFLNLFNFSNDVNILLLQGGATFQNSLIPMNIDERCKLGCFVTGTWGKKTSEDFSKILNNVEIIEANKNDLEHYLQKEYTGFQNTDYLHMTSNETIEGIQIQDFNSMNHGNLIIDMSSDLGSYNFNFDNLSYVYAGAQKNMGIPGVTICFAKDDFLIETDNPKYLNLNLLTKSNSVLNTPPTFSELVLREVFRHFSK